MNSWRKCSVIGLVVCLMHLLWVDVARSADGVAPNPGSTRQLVTQFGVGAKVKVELTSGKKMRGSIESVEDAGFILNSSKTDSSTEVPYKEVARLNLAKNTYKASGQPDSAEAKRVVAELSVGKHIMVKTTSGSEYHGNIQAIDRDHFTMWPDSANAPVQVAYSDILQLGPNMSKATKILIVVAAVAVVVVVVIVAGRSAKVTIPPI
jgi:small nuclear ribonucleoprotein (snRNP)-like protein